MCYAQHPDLDNPRHIGITCDRRWGHDGDHLACLGPGRYIRWPNHTQTKGSK